MWLVGPSHIRSVELNKNTSYMSLGVIFSLFPKGIDINLDDTKLLRRIYRWHAIALTQLEINWDPFQWKHRDFERSCSNHRWFVCSYVYVQHLDKTGKLIFCDIYRISGQGNKQQQLESSYSLDKDFSGVESGWSGCDVGGGSVRYQYFEKRVNGFIMLKSSNLLYFFY